MKLNYTFLLLVLLGFSSCAKEENNYKQAEVNELTIQTDADTYQIEQTKVLKIQPKVQSTLNPNASYTYEWKLYSQTEEFIISTEQNLDKEIDVTPGNYSLLFTAIDSQTKVRSYKSLNLIVNSTLYNGYYIAANKGGKGHLNFVREDGEVFYKVEESFSKTNWSVPIRKVNTAINKGLRFVFVATDDNVYRMNADDLFINGDKKTIFPGEVSPKKDFYFGMNFYKAAGYPTDIFLINNGLVYGNIGPDFGGSSNTYSDPLAYTQDYEIFPFVATDNAISSIFYDNKGKRFLRMGYSTRNLLEMVPNPANQFNLASIGKTAIAAMNGANDEVLYIMKDPNTGSFSIYTIAQFVPAMAKAKQEVSLQTAAEFDQAKFFSALTDRPIFYYATSRNIYKYDLQTNQASLVLQLAGNEQIGDFQVHQQRSWELDKHDSYNKELVLAINSGGAGELRFYSIEADGQITQKVLRKYTGFDEIVDIDYRNRNN